MKHFFSTLVMLFLSGWLFSQSTTITHADSVANNSTTVKVAPKKKLVKISADRLNVTTKAPVNTIKTQNNNGTKEEDTKTK